MRPLAKVLSSLVLFGFTCAGCFAQDVSLDALPKDVIVKVVEFHGSQLVSLTKLDALKPFVTAREILYKQADQSIVLSAKDKTVIASSGGRRLLQVPELRLRTTLKGFEFHAVQSIDLDAIR